MKKANAALLQISSSVNVLAFLSLGLLLGMLNETTRVTILLAVLTVSLLVLRLYVLLSNEDNEAVFRQFHDWLFEASISFIVAAIQHDVPLLSSVLLIVAVILLWAWLLFVLAKFVR